jgi:hypothetical protein
MKRILNLDNKVLSTGRGRGPFTEGGIWDSAPGLNPYLESDTYRGLMAQTGAPTDKTGSVIADIPVAYAKFESGSSYSLYILGLSGHLYDINPNESITDRRSSTQINAPANGMAIIKPRGGSATLLFARETRIGTWNLAGTYPTGWDDGAYVTGTTTPHRPFHSLFDRVFYGNMTYVGQFEDDGSSGITHTAQALDLEGGDTVTALGDDGQYLIIGTSNVVQESYDSFSLTRILYWDTNSSSWNWEVTIPNESSVRGISPDGRYAIGKRGVYAIRFGLNEAELVYSFDDDEAIAFDALEYGHVQSVTAWEGGVMFGKLATALSSFLPGEKPAVFNPLTGVTGDISLIIPDFLQGKTYVGTRSSKLYSFDMTSAGASDDALTTRSIDLEAKWHIQRLDIALPNGIGASDQIDIVVSGDSSASVTLPAITRTRYGNKNSLSVYFGKNLTTTRVKLSITFSAGTPSFSDISLWGEAAAH